MPLPEKIDFKSRLLNGLKSISKLMTRPLPAADIGNAIANGAMGGFCRVIRNLAADPGTAGNPPAFYFKDFAEGVTRDLHSIGLSINPDFFRYHLSDVGGSTLLCYWITLASGLDKKSSAFLYMALIGAGEWYQSTLPKRSFDTTDMLCHLTGVALFLGAHGIRECITTVKEKFNGDPKAFIAANREEIESCAKEIRDSKQFKEIERNFAYVAQDPGAHHYW